MVGILESKKLRLAYKIKKIFKCTSLILSILTLTVLGSCKPSKAVTIEKTGSFFSGFEIRENKVYIKCELVVKNKNSVDKKVKLKAQFREDKNSRLLTEEYLTGFSSDYQTDTFTVNSGDNRIIVYFIGDWGGFNQKHDRKLPNVNLSIVD
jgi:hypothetical protein